MRTLMMLIAFGCTCLLSAPGHAQSPLPPAPPEAATPKSEAPVVTDPTATTPAPVEQSATATDEPPVEITVSGQVRLRDEIRLHIYAPADPMGDATFERAHMRTRLRVDAKVGKHVSAVIELQDVRVLGSEGSTVADTEGVDLKRGTIVLSNPWDLPLTLEIGRYVMKYGDQRLIGDLEWVDQGRTYDGLRVLYRPENFYVDVFLARVRETEVDRDDQYLVGVYAGTEITTDIKIEAYTLLFRDDLEPMGAPPDIDTTFATLGSRVVAQFGNIDATGEAALQVGKLLGQTHTAVALAMKGGYRLTQFPFKPRIGVELAYASGDQDTTDDKSQQFQTLFPTNHLHYGYADLAAWTNVLTARLSASAAPAKGLIVKVDLHHLRLANQNGAWVNAAGATIRPGLSTASTELGNEIDLLVVWTPLRGLKLLAGYSHFFAGQFIDETGNAPDTDFAYAQIGVTF